ncbi:hypothetical protein [uncultured Desulfobulbus sp.]|uniref:hypothetical protein n=1 Tax=uncultured Desulfobulbus sp. TaxID=239745 RepID=UPI0029C94C71|nr:hypothetical protein [uncultured Desulfobulbus sp.]
MRKISFQLCAACVAAGFLLAVSWQLRIAAAEDAMPSDLQHEIEFQMTKGWVDAVSEQGVVIDDMSHSLSSLKVFDHKGLAKERSSLKPGQYVAFIREEDGTRVYLLEGKGDRPEPTELSTSSRTVETKKEPSVRKVDGVWKN